MSNTVLIKRSGTSSTVPSTLQSGEIAINYADGKLFYKNAADAIVGSKLISNITGTSNQITVSETSGTFALSLPSSVYVNSLFVDGIEIDTTGATPSYVLAYNGTKFVPTISSASISLNEISDVVITSPQSGEVIKYDGSQWINNLETGYNNSYATVIGDGIASQFSINHNFGTRDIFVQCRNNNSPYENIEVRWEATSNNQVTLDFSTIPSSSSIRVNVYASVGVVGPSAFSQTIGDGTNDTFNIGHNLQTRDVLVSARNANSPYEVIEVNWKASTENIVEVIFSSPPSSNSVRITVYAAAGASGVTSINGTTNEIEVNQTTGGVTVGLPNNVSISGDLTVGGNVTINGDTTTINTTTLSVEDNIVILNSNVTTSPSLDAGIEIERGTSSNVLLRWNETNDKWELTSNGSNYYNILDTSSSIDEISNVSVTSSTPGQFLKYDGSNWINADIPTINTLDDVGDVVITSATPNQFLKWDGLQWVNGDVPQINTLDDVGDVTISSAASGQFLKWNGSAWVNDAIDLGTDTTGDYVQSIVAGTGISLSNNSGEGATPTITNTGVVSVNGSSGVITGIATTSGNLSQFGSTTSSQLAGVISDETGSGSLVFGTSPTVTTSLLTGSSSFNLFNTTATTINFAGAATALNIGAATGITTINNNLVVTGDLTVSGTTTTINTTELLIEDNLIVLNTGSAATPSYNAGIEIERGDFTNVQIRWNESTGKWQFTNDGTTYKDLGSGGVTVSDTIPVAPAQGDMWYESDTGGLFAFYDSQWIEIGGSAAYNEIIGTIQSKGDLLAGTASQTLSRIGVGANNTRLIADSTQTTGLRWAPDTQNNLIDAKGDLLAGSADNTIAKVSVGGDGQVLMANSLFSTGVTWSNPPTNRNLFINGGFAIDQRGKATSHTVTAGAALEYTVDRWYEFCTGANVTAARTQFSPSAGLPYDVNYQYTFTGATSNTLVGFGQRIEALNATSVSGAFCTLSAVLHSSVSKVVTWTAYYANSSDSFGTLASPTRTQIATGTFTTTTLGASPTSSNKFSTYFQVTANQRNGIEIVFTCPSLTAGQTLTIANVQFEQGLTPTPFEQRPIGVELALCQRYYVQDAYTDRFTFFVGGDGYMNSNSYSFPVQMRIAPTITLRDNSAVLGQVYAVYGAGSYGGITASATVSNFGFSIIRSGMTLNVAGKAACSFTASAEL